MQQVYDTIDGALTPLRVAQQAAARDPSPSGANALAAAQQEFDTNTKPQLNDNINRALASLDQRFNQIFRPQISEYGVTVPSADPIFEAAKQAYLSEKAALATIQDLVNADNPSASEILKSYSFMRGALAIADAPIMQAMADLTVAHPTLFNNLDSLGLDKAYQSVWNNHERGPHLAEEIETALTSARALQVYKAETIPHTTSEEFLDGLDQIRRASPNPSGVADDDRVPEKTVSSGMAQLDHYTKGFETNKNPKFANETSALAYLVGWVDTIGNVLDTGAITHEPDKAKVREMMASPAFQTAIGHLKAGRRDPRVVALTTRLTEYWDKAAGDSRTQWSNEINKTARRGVIAGVPMVRFFDPNLSGMRKDGVVTYTVNRDRLERAVRAMPLNAQLDDKSIQSQVERHIRGLERQAEELGKQMTLFTQAATNLDWARQPGQEPNYLLQWIQKGDADASFQDIAGGLTDEQVALAEAREL
jgi:hypothetical protein